MEMKIRTIRSGCGKALLLFSIAFAGCGGPTEKAQSPPDCATDGGKRDGPQTTADRQYPIESCIIEYTGEVGGVRGTEVVYFDKWGARRRVTRTMGGSKRIETLTISDQDSMTQIDLLAKTGTRLKAPYVGRDPGIEVLLAAGEKVGTEIVAGSKCDKWKIPGATLWVWNSIPLKTQIEKDGKVTAIQIAVDVKENVSIPDEKFQVPLDIKIAEPTKPKQILKALGYH